MSRSTTLIVHRIGSSPGLRLRQRLPVKRRRHEMLTDMNARQIARLDPAQRAECARVFRRHRDVLDYFGHGLR